MDLGFTFIAMQKLLILFLIIYFSCTPSHQPVPESIISNQPGQSMVTPFSAGLMNSYDVWEFLKVHPSETQVLQTIGRPDSIWVDEYQESKVYYYFIPAIQDYNSIELNIQNATVTGFEWD